MPVSEDSQAREAQKNSQPACAWHRRAADRCICIPHRFRGCLRCITHHQISANGAVPMCETVS